MKIKKSKAVYDDSSIKDLEGLDPVKKRPGMYIGDVTSYKGTYQIIKEAIDNSLDEALVGHCDTIDVILHTELNSVAIVDNGRGIPQESIVRVLTKLHSGGKFDNKAYSVSGGLHGVGVSSTNALSTKLTCYSRRGRKIVCAKFKNGGDIVHKERRVPKVLLNTMLSKTQVTSNKWKSGTIIEFVPDFKILTYGKLPVKEIFTWLSTIPELCPGLKINFIAISKSKTIKKVLFSKKGFLDRAMANDFSFSSKAIDCLITLSGNAEFKGYVNTIPTDDGSHITGVFRALKSALSPYNKKIPSVKILKDTVSGTIHAKVSSPNFTGQIKEKLGDTRVENLVYDTLKVQLQKFFKRKPKIARKIINTAKQIQKIDDDRKSKLKAVRNIEKDSKRGKVPVELAVSQTKDKNKRELFIVEGKSAGGTAKAARNREYQEVLALRGKIANAEKQKLSDVLSSEIKNIILSVGDADPDKGRVGKVIFLTDPDSDGQHITVLLITCFIKLFPKWIEAGRVFTVEAPLFHAIYKGKRVFGNTAKEVIAKSSKSINVMRTKGWGECTSQNSFLFTQYGLLTYKELIDNYNSPYKGVCNNNNLLIGSFNNIRKPKFIKCGYKKLYEITTKSGYKLSVSLDHITPVMCKGIIKELKTKDIKVNDYLLVSRGANLWGPLDFNENIASMAGHIIADGTLRRNYIAVHDDHRSYYQAKFKWKLNRLGIKFNNYLRKGVTCFTDTVEIRRTDNQKLFNILKMLGYSYNWHSYSKRVPIRIRQGSREVVCAFIRSYIGRNGWFEENPTIIAVTSVSYKLLYDVKLLLANLGIIAKLKTIPKGGYKKHTNEVMWSLGFSGAKNLKIFSDYIGFIDDRQSKLDRYLSHKKYNANIDIIPGIKQHWKKLCEKYRIKKFQSYFKIGKNKVKIIGPKVNIAENVTWEWFNKHWANNLGGVKKIDTEFYNTLKFIKNSKGKIFFDKIISIKEKGYDKVVDFSFDNEDKLFTANGIITHNSRMDDLKYIAFDHSTRKLILLESNRSTIKKSLNIMGKDVAYRKDLLNIELEE